MTTLEIATALQKKYLSEKPDSLSQHLESETPTDSIYKEPPAPVPSPNETKLPHMMPISWIDTKISPLTQVSP